MTPLCNPRHDEGSHQTCKCPFGLTPVCRPARGRQGHKRSLHFNFLKLPPLMCVTSEAALICRPCDRRIDVHDCCACGRHPSGLARDKVDGPVAAVRNVDGPVAAVRKVMGRWPSPKQFESARLLFPSNMKMPGFVFQSNLNMSRADFQAK